jgi:1,4-alpha-glucan branching enzyme
VSDQICQNSTKQTGMGAIPHAEGVAFRVWAPHADSVHVVGSFNDWEQESSEMEREEQGYWYLNIENAKVGDEYKFLITNGENRFDRIDPYARAVTNSVGNAIVVDPEFDWGPSDFQMPPWNELVIYELHVGTFHRTDPDHPGDFDDVCKKFEYLKQLGINAIQIMPSAEFAGDISWGYNPAHIFAVESAYGGPRALKQLVKLAHENGLAVIMDVVYNHFGPSDLDLWQFDGWSENDKGGIYFYNDWRSSTPWGETRPDYGRGEVRQFIFDNAMMWVDEFRMDGLRYDMTLFMRSVDGSDDKAIHEGWTLAQWINREIRKKFPHKLIIAEDLRTNSAITRPEDQGGANFSTQWDEAFVHPIRQVVSVAEDQYRNMYAVSHAIEHQYNLDAFERVIYSESHDEVANGKKRVPSEISEADPDNWYARRRSTLAAAMVFTAPGIPMIFQGQELLLDGWFDDTDAIDWSQVEQQKGILQLYRDLIRLRLNRDGTTRGLTGQSVEIRHLNQEGKVIAFRRWLDGGSNDETVVLANFSANNWDDYRIGFVSPGKWKVRLDSGASFYGGDFEGSQVSEVETNDAPADGFPHSASIRLTPYSVIIFSQE